MQSFLLDEMGRPLVLLFLLLLDMRHFIADLWVSWVFVAIGSLYVRVKAISSNRSSTEFPRGVRKKNQAFSFF